MAYSAKLTYKKQINGLESPSGSFTMQTPLNFTTAQKRFVRLIKASISSSIPNVYIQPATSSSPAINNGLFRISIDGGATYTFIQLPTGIYSFQFIEAALNTACAQINLWADPTSPGFHVRYNEATQLSYILIDSTKLTGYTAGVGPYLSLDLDASYVWDLLGYNTVARLLVTDLAHPTLTFYSDQIAKMNWIGDTITVYVDGLGNFSYENGVFASDICTIDLSTTGGQVPNAYVYEPRYSDDLPLVQCPETIMRLGIRFVGDRLDYNGQPREVFLMDGAVQLICELRRT